MRKVHHTILIEPRSRGPSERSFSCGSGQRDFQAIFGAQFSPFLSFQSFQRRELIAAQLKETPYKSDRQIASSLGVTHPTVTAARSELETSGDVERFTTSTDTLGRKQPCKRKYQYVDESKEGEAAILSAVQRPALVVRFGSLL